MAHLEPIIDIRDLSFNYDEHSILENVSFVVNKGDYLGLIGPNGSGKTTLLKLLLGILKPQKGTISVFGQSPDKLKDRYKIGYVPQRITQADIQFPATVEEIVFSGRTAKAGLFRSFSKKDHAQVNKALELVGISDYRNRLIGELSGGQRQRVFIARALAGEPTVLILDEPTVGVDLASQEAFYTLLCELNTKHKLTIVLVSHDIDVVAQEVKTVLFLNRSVIAYGSPKDLLKEGNLEKMYGEKMKFIVHHH